MPCVTATYPGILGVGGRAHWGEVVEHTRVVIFAVAYIKAMQSTSEIYAIHTLACGATAHRLHRDLRPALDELFAASKSRPMRYWCCKCDRTMTNNAVFTEI